MQAGKPAALYTAVHILPERRKRLCVPGPQVDADVSAPGFGEDPAKLLDVSGKLVRREVTGSGIRFQWKQAGVGVWVSQDDGIEHLR